MRISFALGCGLFLAASSGCGTVRVSGPVALQQRFADRCLFPPQRLPHDTWNEGLEQQANATRLQALPIERQAVARAALAQGIALPEDGTPEAWRALASQLKQQVPYFELEVTTSRNQVDCLGDQLTDIHTEVVRSRAAHTLTWSIISTLLSGIGALASGIVDIKLTEDLPVALITISAGVTSAGMAIIALNEPHAKVPLEHKRNVLRAIWRGRNESQLFPAFVWHMLQLPSPGATLSPRDLLLHEWKNVIDAHAKTPEERSEWEALLFGDGGIYQLEQLETREAFYNSLQQAIQSLHQAVYLVNELAP
jgi:hypothetical protein